MRTQTEHRAGTRNVGTLVHPTLEITLWVGFAPWCLRGLGSSHIVTECKARLSIWCPPRACRRALSGLRLLRRPARAGAHPRSRLPASERLKRMQACCQKTVHALDDGLFSAEGRLARPVVSCNAAADLLQTVAKKVQDAGKFAAVLGASALVASVRDPSLPPL